MNIHRVIEAFSALAHEHRLKIYRLLVERGPRGLSAGAIAEGVRLVPSSLTFHLQALQRAGLIAKHREGRQIIYSSDFATMNALVSFLTENCCAGSGDTCAAVCKPAAPPAGKRGRAA